MLVKYTRQLGIGSFLNVSEQERVYYGTYSINDILIYLLKYYIHEGNADRGRKCVVIILIYYVYERKWYEILSEGREKKLWSNEGEQLECIWNDMIPNYYDDMKKCDNILKKWLMKMMRRYSKWLVCENDSSY